MENHWTFAAFADWRSSSVSVWDSNWLIDFAVSLESAVCASASSGITDSARSAISLSISRSVGRSIGADLACLICHWDNCRSTVQAAASERLSSKLNLKTLFKSWLTCADSSFCPWSDSLAQTMRHWGKAGVRRSDSPIRRLSRVEERSRQKRAILRESRPTTAMVSRWPIDD